MHNNFNGYHYGKRTSSVFSPQHWFIIQGACSILGPFEETKMESHYGVGISDTIPLMFLMEHSVFDLIDQALGAQKYV